MKQILKIRVKMFKMQHRNAAVGHLVIFSIEK